MKQPLLVLMAAIALPACSTITEGPSQAMLIATDPPGARCAVKRRGEVIATVEQTPGTVAVHKSPFDLAIECSRPGYYAGAAVADSRMDNMTYGNLIIGGAVGLIVDASTGAWNEYPRTVRIRMLPRYGTAAAGAPASASFTARAEAIQRRADRAVAATQRSCARQRTGNCLDRIEAIEARRLVEREALVTEHRILDPASATPVF